MAKKKTESTSKTESAPTAAAKKAPAKKPTAGPAGDMPAINTSAAAAAAAALVGNRISLGGSPSTPRAETSTFKQMKENLNKHTAGVADLLPSAGTQKKSGSPFEQNKQTGKNQTFGADVNRTGVPRRTGG